MKYDYDLFVVGGGSGGVRAGRLTAASGKKVGIAEEYRYGGTCVIRGCVPKKLFVYASQFSGEFEAAKGFGWTVGKPSFNWQTLIANKDRELDRLEGLYRAGLDRAGADMFDSRAELVGPNEIRLVALDKTVTAERILIAVGGTPNRGPEIPGLHHAITSEEAFHLEELPKSIAISGGGYIAVEFAGIFNGLGVETTLVYRGEEILRGFDNDLRVMLHKQMEEAGIRVICGETFARIDANSGSGYDLHLSGDEVLDVGLVMQAIGRVPNTGNLGLRRTGVQMDRQGAIIVNEYSRTNIDNIWAVGDVTNRVSLTPVAIHEAMCFFQTEYEGNPQKPDHHDIATAVFSQPEIGTVGLSEEQASTEIDKVDVYRAAFRPMKNTLGGKAGQMLTKLVVDSSSGRVVGAHILGPDAGEMAQILGILVKMGAKKADFDNAMAVHPTAAEELVTMYQPSYRILEGVRQD